ncbi:alpha/beta hydrolase [Streptomyces sp. 6N223]|uniref:alpha/beta hydrolase n=1 Tax=Streptomyces sp. 6N223 TaxID=3457412 RepID=UPI003FD41806
MNLRAALVRTALATLSRIAPRAAGRLALRLFRLPAGRSRPRPAEEPVMRRARRDRLRVNGADVEVYAWGSGERPVLLMHGWASRASRFAPLVQALLERGYSPVAFDAPGHGDSGGATTTILDYREIARRLHERHGRFAAVIGHSVGGTAAFFAIRGQVTADRLVSISAPSDFDHVVDRFCAQLGVGPRLKAELRRQIERRMFPGEANIWARFAATHRPAEHTHPVLVIHDDADDTIDTGQARRIAAAYGQQADLLVTRGLGHRRLIADPAVIDAVLDFAAATEPLAEPATQPAGQGHGPAGRP